MFLFAIGDLNWICCPSYVRLTGGLDSVWKSMQSADKEVVCVKREIFLCGCLLYKANGSTGYYEPQNENT